jgi:hypothetical protein
MDVQQIPRQSMTTTPAPQRLILFVAANPSGTDHLRLDREAKEIQAGLLQSTYRDNFRFEQIWAATPGDMMEGILRLRPQVVHFSGHGNGEDGLVMENEEGQPRLLSAQKLSKIFARCENDVQCVVLNACFSEVQAEAIAQQIPYTIGMNRAISDQAAIKFAEGFYTALGEGRDFKAALDYARTFIEVEDIPEESTPVLIPYRKAIVVSPQKDKDNPDQPPVVITVIPPWFLANEGTVELGSPLYVRPALEEQACEIIAQPGTLLRIKSPQGMGKSSLAIRVLDRAKSQGHRTLNLDLQEINSSIFADLNRFSQWFCASVGQPLGGPTKVGEFWDDMFGPNGNCTKYFQRHVLTGSPLTLMLDNFDRIFDYPYIEVDFCSLLRSWHEKAKSNPQWGQLRLIIVYSQESYVPKDINQSPFNVGVPIELGPWTKDEIEKLVSLYNLALTPPQQHLLMSLTGGHPQLVRLTLYHLAFKDMTFDQIIATASTEEGIYCKHLLERLNYLEAYPDLKEAMQQVVASDGPVCLKSQEACRLANMGLVRREKNRVLPLCEVYRDYFRERLV